MKIVLIEPRGSEANVYSDVPMPLLGPVYLGTILKNKGHEVEIYNEDIQMPDYSKIDADLIGVSILTSTSKRGYEIADKFPKEKVIIGGVHASLLPDEALKHARQVVIGEADLVIDDIVTGKITEPKVQGPPVTDLDKLPFPDFSLIKGLVGSPYTVPISTSRGCPFDCSFCSVTKLFGRRYRFRSAESIMKELKATPPGRVFFCDDNFTANPERLRKVLDMIIKNPVYKWSCQVRCEIARDDKLIHQMKKAGCTVVCIGFESINEKTLKSYDKKQTVKDIVEAIKSFHRRHIRIHGMFVLGGDDDTTQTIWETARFAIKQKIDTIQLMILTPFPGTKVYDDLEREKRIFTKDWKLYDGQHIVYKPKLISARELQANVVDAYLKFYSITRSIAWLLKLRLRNAAYTIMGYKIIHRWKKKHFQMNWLPTIKS